MSFYIHNTLTGKKEEFVPIRDGEIRMYNCGPTVYDYAHIGNLRAYVFADILRRTLEYDGYRVTQVVNITDVGHLSSDADDGEDKMVKALKREGKPLSLKAMRKVSDFYAAAFLQDLALLNIRIPNVMPRASEHIAEDIEIIKILEEKGFAYRIVDGIYFDASRFPAYGKLGLINIAGLKPGARVGVNEKKRNPNDFALWKFSTDDVGFESPWGRGFPGWHIECSAMSRKYLGQPFDIHTGGIDNIPIHHNNEIAQSEAAYGVPLARYWLHNEYLVVRNEKMAKSEENFITLRALCERGISPLAYRYFLLGAHYRTPINFSFDALKAAQTAYFKLLLSFPGVETGKEKLSQKYSERFSDAINDDLNTAVALSLMWEVLKDFELSDSEKRALLVHFDEALGLDIENQSWRLKKEIESVPLAIRKLAEKRATARASKDFNAADALREEIQNSGFEVMDLDGQFIIHKRVL